MSNRSRVLVLLAAALIAACSAMQQQRTEPVRADQGEFKNLKVLPQNIAHDDLIMTMRGFARSLGTRCEGCHVPIPGEENKFDFPNDAKEEKRIARQMILMTRNINGNYIAKLPHDHAEPPAEQPKVVCWTCHRGKMEPEAPPPPRQQQTQPQGN
jgi:hypothetical protein